MLFFCKGFKWIGLVKNYKNMNVVINKENFVNKLIILLNRENEKKD